MLAEGTAPQTYLIRLRDDARAHLRRRRARPAAEPRPAPAGSSTRVRGLRAPTATTSSRSRPSSSTRMERTVGRARRGAVHLPVRRQRHRRRADPRRGPRCRRRPGGGLDRPRPGAASCTPTPARSGRAPTRCGTPSPSSACRPTSRARASSSARSTPASAQATARSPTSAATATTTPTRSAPATTSAPATRPTAPPAVRPALPVQRQAHRRLRVRRRQPQRHSALDYDGHGSHTVVDVRRQRRQRRRRRAADVHDPALRHLRRRPARQRHLLPRLLHPRRADRRHRPGDRRRGRRHQLLDRLVLAVGAVGRLRHGRVPQRPRRRDLRRHLQRQRRPRRRHHRLAGRRPVDHVRRRVDAQPRTTATPSPASPAAPAPLADIPGKSVTGALPRPTPIVVRRRRSATRSATTTAGNEAAFTGQHRRLRPRRRQRSRREVRERRRPRARSASSSTNDALHGDSLLGDEYALPGVFISFDDGQALKAWLATGTGHAGRDRRHHLRRSTTPSATSWPASRRAAPTGRSTRSSRRSPRPASTSWPPSAPTRTTSDEHGFISGTSMASPHVAGAGALLTPGPSRLVAGADAVGADDHGPHRRSSTTTARRPRRTRRASGHVDVGAAALAGLLFDETLADYLAANPDEGGDPKTLNLPSFADSQCLAVCSWTAHGDGARQRRRTGAGRRHLDGVDRGRRRASPSTSTCRHGHGVARRHA